MPAGPGPVWTDDPLPAISALSAGRPVLALDDDPTGTQTVRDVPVLTQWSPERLHGSVWAGPRWPTS